jgi:ATP-dependent DNA ligase
MLAYPLEQGRLERLGKNFFVQPKINGERARLEWYGDEPVLLSSYNNPFSYLDHIKDALRGLYSSLGPIPLDGEIYVHGWSREQIDSALRRTVNKSDFNSHLEYHMFDICTNGEIQAIRIGMLLDIKNTYILPDCLKIVDTNLIDDSSLDDMCQLYLESGYEGAILRNFHAFWTPKRSVGILKYKPTETDEYTILKVHEAIDKYGLPKDMAGGFSVKAPDLNETFKVGAGKLNHLQRTEIWRNRQFYIGKTLIVKHEKIKTTNGIPVCCVAVEVL